MIVIIWRAVCGVALRFCILQVWVHCWMDKARQGGSSNNRTYRYGVATQPWLVGKCLRIVSILDAHDPRSASFWESFIPCLHDLQDIQAMMSGENSMFGGTQHRFSGFEDIVGKQVPHIMS